jgi:hypothetical protein
MIKMEWPKERKAARVQWSSSRMMPLRLLRLSIWLSLPMCVRGARARSRSRRRRRRRKRRRKRKRKRKRKRRLSRI